MTTPITSGTAGMSLPHDPEIGVNVGELLLQNEATRRLVETQTPAPMETATRCNVGRTEQKLRLAAGGALLGAAAFAPVGRGWRIAMAAMGAMEMVTGATRYCPAWHALGINTCRAD